MALIIRNGLDIYDKITNVYDGEKNCENFCSWATFLTFVIFTDVRVREMFLLSNPFKPLAIIAVYLYFVLKMGPKLMENRKPMKLDSIIKCYNLLQVAICSYVTLRGYYHSFGQGYSIICEPVDYSTTNRHAVQLTKIAHYYFLSKVVDLFDTVFFVLKKKQTHVSFLHVYHHGGMVMLSFLGAKYFAGGKLVGISGVILGLFIRSCISRSECLYGCNQLLDPRHHVPLLLPYLDRQ